MAGRTPVQAPETQALLRQQVLRETAIAPTETPGEVATGMTPGSHRAGSTGRSLTPWRSSNRAIREHWTAGGTLETWVQACIGAAERFTQEHHHRAQREPVDVLAGLHGYLGTGQGREAVSAPLVGDSRHLRLRITGARATPENVASGRV